MKTSLAPGSKVVTDYLDKAGLDCRTSSSSASTWSATAAPPASATRARCPRPIAKAIDEGRPGRRRRALAATATSRGASTRWCGPTTWPRRRWWSPTPWPARIDIDLATRAARHRTRTASRSSSQTSGRRRRRSPRPSRSRVDAEHVHKRSTARSSTATSAGSGSPVPDGRALRLGRELDLRQEAAVLRRAWRRDAGAARPTSTARACWRCSATASPPTTSRRPARSKRRPRRASTSIAHGVQPRGLQLLRRAPRQPRGDGARHVRQHPAARTCSRPAPRAASTRHLPDGEPMSHLRRLRAVSRRRACRWSCSPARSTARGSSRDWAAKGPRLLGVRAVIAESYERIHRSNLVGMGVLPLQFVAGQSAQSLGLTGEEVYEISGIAGGVTPGKKLTVRAGEQDRSRCWRASTRPTRPTTTATAASCRTSCAACWRSSRFLREKRGKGFELVDPLLTSPAFAVEGWFARTFPPPRGFPGERRQLRRLELKKMRAARGQGARGPDKRSVLNVREHCRGNAPQ